MNFKKFLSAILATSFLTASTAFAMGNDTTAPDERVEKAVTWAIEIANNNVHGYSQGAENATSFRPYTGSREGALPGASSQDFDCSSLVYWAFQKGGFDIIGEWRKNPEYQIRYQGQQYSGDADTIWTDLEKIGGFTKYSWSEVKNNLMRGDIICIPEKHVAIYIGNGKTVEARGVNNPKNHGHYEPGDQGGEIDFYNAYDRSWVEVYRYTGK